MDERTRRIGLNEALFRSVNDEVGRMTALAIAVTEKDERMEAVCECGSADCTATILTTLDEYEAVRRDPALFMLLPGHESPDVEDVVSVNRRFAVVRKHAGAPEQLAKKTDPRSP
jgi:hypothetical protein